MKKSTRILLAVILCLVLVAISVPGIFSFNTYNYDKANRYTAGGCEIESRVEAIDISWIAGKVNIACHDGDEIILSETASRKLKTAEKVHWMLDGDTLYVKYVRAGKGYSNRLDKELTLLLPEKLQLDQMQISVVSANVEAELPEAEVVNMNSVSGEVEMSLQQTKNVQVDTVSGDVQLFCAAAPENIRADGVSADMTVQLPENAGFAAELDSVSGRISGQLLEGSTGEKSYTCGSGECHIRMNSVSGDLKLDAYHR